MPKLDRTARVVSLIAGAFMAAAAAATAVAQTGSSGSTGSTGSGGTTGSTRGLGPAGTPGPAVGPSATQPGGPSPQRLPGPGITTPGTNRQETHRPGATSPTISEPTPRNIGPDMPTGSNTPPNQPGSVGGSLRSLQSGSGGSTRETGADMSFQECVDTWSPATHMSREQFAETCRRVGQRDEIIRK